MKTTLATFPVYDHNPLILLLFNFSPTTGTFPAINSSDEISVSFPLLSALRARSGINFRFFSEKLSSKEVPPSLDECLHCAIKRLNDKRVFHTKRFVLVGKSWKNQREMY